MDRNWTNIDYLLRGGIKQQLAYYTLTTLGILDLLKPYNPILVGTIPIAIDVEYSDLDILCEVHDFDAFVNLADNHFSCLPNYNVSRGGHGVLQYIVINFKWVRSPIEIFAQAVPTLLQNGYRHMVIEHRLIELLGPSFRQEIIRLKSQGVKTEPAFAMILNLKGNPYESILELENFEDQELLRLYKQSCK